jgi:hypothetical protein
MFDEGVKADSDGPRGGGGPCAPYSSLISEYSVVIDLDAFSLLDETK